MHISYCYYTRKFAGTMRGRRTMPGRGQASSKERRCVCPIVAVSRDYSWMGEVAATVLWWSFLSAIDFARGPTYISWLDYWNEILSDPRAEIMLQHRSNSALSPAIREVRPRNYLDVFYLRATHIDKPISMISIEIDGTKLRSILQTGIT